MLYPRILEKTIVEHMFIGQIIVLYGPRQVGKTTLTRKIYDDFSGEKLFFRGDIPSERDIFRDPEPSKILSYIGNTKLVIIDEAQMIENIGTVLKVMFDTHPEIQFFVTGSSSFDLANKIREPLTGRALEYMLYPLSYEEILLTNGKLNIKQTEAERITTGWYPKIVGSNNNDAREYLEILQNNTLYKDIFTLENIKKPLILERLVIFLANNIGTVVRIGSIAREIKTTEQTVNRYINILEKMFIIKKLGAFSNNPNNENKGGYKIYFTDIGLRNSIIKNHNKLDIRSDAGALFENYVVMERIKYLNNHRIFVNNYFWQNNKQKEVDYIEEYMGYLYAYEYKLSERKTSSLKLFNEEYSEKVKNSQVITYDNYDQFVLNDNF